MAKPEGLQTKIFLDSGDPNETREAVEILGFLDGQTTNPSLIAKNPDTKKRIEEGNKFTKDEIYDFYKKTAQEISKLIPEGSVSVEIYADQSTKKKEMLEEGRKMFEWIPNAHVKFPITEGGVAAAETFIQEGKRVNMTLCFTQDQGVAIYGATRGATKGDVFLSPFIGRLDDQNENGMDLIENTIKMYKEGDGHVEVLVASVRNIDHFLRAIQLGADIITSPLSILKEWAETGMSIPDNTYSYKAPEGAEEIPYKEVDLEKNWKEFDLHHDLTDKGIERFAEDWNNLLT